MKSYPRLGHPIQRRPEAVQRASTGAPRRPKESQREPRSAKIRSDPARMRPDPAASSFKIKIGLKWLQNQAPGLPDSAKCSESRGGEDGGPGFAPRPAPRPKIALIAPYSPSKNISSFSRTPAVLDRDREPRLRFRTAVAYGC